MKPADLIVVQGTDMAKSSGAPNATMPQGSVSEIVHDWFELSYAQYLTIPRSIMEAMPEDWQRRITQCLDELDDAFDWRPKDGRYWVKLKDGKGRYVNDPLMEYRRPDWKYIQGLRTK